jgi:hypothetical protein
MRQYKQEKSVHSEENTNIENSRSRINTQPGLQRHFPLRKLPALIYSSLFFLICSLPLLGAAVGIKSENLEKRTLAAKPDLITENKPNWKYTEQFDSWYTDNFIFRPQLIAGWHDLNQNLFNISGSERVIAGKNNWLFFADTLDDYLRQNRLTDLEMARLSNIIRLQDEWLARRGIDYIFTIAPNKNSIYPEYMPENYKPAEAPDITELMRQQPESDAWLDLHIPLRETAQSGQQAEYIYHFTDSHWNNAGALTAAQIILTRASDNLPELPTENLPGSAFEIRQDWQGDLAVMLDPSSPQTENQYYYSTNSTYRFKRPVRSMEDILIETTSNQGEYNLLMFRDSFANALIDMLSPVFKEAIYSRALPHDYSLIEKADIDLVILEIVERNLKLLLEYAPVMTADTIEDQKLIFELAAVEYSDASDIFYFIENKKSSAGHRVSAIFKPGHFDEAERIIIELPSTGQLYEAYPIIERPDEETSKILTGNWGIENSATDSLNGFTLDLSQEAAGIWQQNQEIIIYVQQNNHWESVGTGVGSGVGSGVGVGTGVGSILTKPSTRGSVTGTGFTGAGAGSASTSISPRLKLRLG